MFLTLLKEVAEEGDIRLAAFSDDWLFCLQKGSVVTYVFGYDFELNSATAKLITKDKSATSDLLAFHDIPHLSHRIFHNPQMAAYVPMTGNWTEMIAYFEAHGCDVVCKPNEGTGGQGVTRVRTQVQLEAAVLQLFRLHRSICLSPFENIDSEYRVALLSGSCEFVYRKQRPTLTADGIRPVRELLAQWLASQPDFNTASRLLISGTGDDLNLDEVPAKGGSVELNWRHNLGQGAVPSILSPGGLHDTICDLAIRATKALGVELASVDIVDIGGEYRVLEINSGIMMESLSILSPELRALDKRFYKRIVRLAFERHAVPGS
jgi:D-alanine-D-alanine ligase-like ATP-grasp enzyme